MTSSVAWLSYDADERDSTLKLIEYFKDEGTLDELGIGSIRDSFADHLFPGTSVIQTRARYFLFVPWLLDLTARERGGDLADKLRDHEIQLISALIASGETDGVFGRQARSSLKRMPSAVYWAGLGRYGLRTTDTTIAGFLRSAAAAAERRRRAPDADDAGLAERHLPPGIDPHLATACPPPDDLLTTATLALPEHEAAYLRDRIVAATQGSLLAWLLANERRDEVNFVWQHAARSDFPEHLATVVDHGERFHHAIYGAALLYNLLLAEKKQSDGLVGEYRGALTDWHERIADLRVWSGWPRDEFWAAVRSSRVRVSHGTVVFVNAWLDGAARVNDVGRDEHLRNLVAAREHRLKGRRARLINQAALDTWRGESGIVPLDYRWRVTNRILADIFDGLGVTA